tara:strand:+ start:21594 stop:21845 length:252 start_codon:yes stop_codon:yes gene_type:complete
MKDQNDISVVETTGEMLNSIMRTGISSGNTVFNLVATCEDDSLTVRLSSGLKNQDKVQLLIDNAVDPVKAQAFYDKIRAETRR